MKKDRPLIRVGSSFADEEIFLKYEVHIEIKLYY